MKKYAIVVERAARAFLEDNEELMEEIESTIRKKANAEPVVAVAVIEEEEDEV